MMAPFCVDSAIKRIWPAWKGVSRNIKTTRRRSLRQTSAARAASSPLKQLAIPLKVFIEQGATNIPSVLKEPDEIDAPISSLL
jgi:hypothetical protein